MIWIELIGPSGVGKSYWYEKFMQKHTEFEPQQLILNRIYKSADLWKLPLKINVMFWVYRMNLYRISKHFKYKLFIYFLKVFESKSKLIFNENDDIIIEKYLENMNILKEPQIVVLKKIAYFNQKLIEFKFYQHYLEENDIYIAEDGLMHLSPIFIKELHADKVLIFEKEYDKLVYQRLNRAKNRPTVFIEFLYSEDRLKMYIEDYYKVYIAKIQCVIKNSDSNQTKRINLDDTDVLKEMHQSIASYRVNLSEKK